MVIKHVALVHEFPVIEPDDFRPSMSVTRVSSPTGLKSWNSIRPFSAMPHRMLWKFDIRNNNMKLIENWEWKKKSYGNEWAVMKLAQRLSSSLTSSRLPLDVRWFYINFFFFCQLVPKLFWIGMFCDGCWSEFLIKHSTAGGSNETILIG